MWVKFLSDPNWGEPFGIKDRPNMRRNAILTELCMLIETSQHVAHLHTNLSHYDPALGKGLEVAGTLKTITGANIC